MSPLDDELRSTLTARTAALTPSPDLLAGVERRAGRMRRRRVAGAVAGSALAVSALGLGGPLLASSLTSAAPEPGELATVEPVPSAAPVDGSAHVLDPAHPWPYRGDDRVRVQGDLDAYAVEVATSRGVLLDDLELVPLFGQVHEPSATPELVLLARADGGPWSWLVARATESGPELVVDLPLEPGTSALAAALPGDEVSRLLVVAAPTVDDLDYAPDGASEWSAMTALRPGVAVAPLDGDAATDRYRVRSPEGDVLVEASAPDGEVLEGEPEGPGTGTPASGADVGPYLLDPGDPWPFRGDETAREALAAADQERFEAGGAGRADQAWSASPLYGAVHDSGTTLLVVLHVHDSGDVVVTTTWQTGDREPQQHEQVVLPGGLALLQSVAPTDLDDGSLLLVALASPESGGTVLEQGTSRRPDGLVDRGVGLWVLEQGSPPGTVRLYTDGDGLEYWQEPARRS